LLQRGLVGALFLLQGEGSSCCFPRRSSYILAVALALPKYTQTKLRMAAAAAVTVEKKTDEKKKKKSKDGDEKSSLYPIMRLAQDMHRLTVTSPDDRLEVETAIFQEIAEQLENPSLYKLLRDKLYAEEGMLSTAVKLQDDDLAQMEVKNARTLETLEAAVEEAKESAGDMEVMDARLAVAEFACKSLSQEDALAAYQKVMDLPKISSGKKIDAWMTSARIASFYSSTAKTDEFLEQAKKTAGDGADWDRRNRLKMYNALQWLLHRNFQESSAFLLEGVATFNCTELCTYNEFIVYTILTNMLHLPRPELKDKIIDGSEIISVASEIPAVVGQTQRLRLWSDCRVSRFSVAQIKLVRSYYDCNYKEYLHALVDIEKVLFEDRFLQPHASFWMRELHVLAYKQYLDSYQSVQLAAMASAFGVSERFLDYHASRMIAAGSLSAKIDKFGGVIVTSRPDQANAKYREVIQKGDLLLNRIQKLGRVVDV
jgi:26S proteasome regulatory subunit N7